MFLYYNFTQLVNEPTRMTPNSETVFDLICTNVCDRTSNPKVIKVTLL